MRISVELKKFICSGALPQKDRLAQLLSDLADGKDDADALYAHARKVSLDAFRNKVFLRGLIEIGNVCRNDCYYCGIRRSNRNVRRYVLSAGEILEACRRGYAEGFRTFVLQGGENPALTDSILVPLVKDIKRYAPGCAVTLSLGERSHESYRILHEAGADRYLLRHESCDEEYFYRLHPRPVSEDLPGDSGVTNFSRRMAALGELKRIGYQTGTGFMVGTPGQTFEQLASELHFIRDFAPEMVGIGPFIPHPDTPFGGLSDTCWTAERKAVMTRILISFLRIMSPHLLIPSTTALNTISADGRYLGILAGANVIMPNISPDFARKSYTLYEGKVTDGGETSAATAMLERRLNDIGYEVDWSRGDYVPEMLPKNGR